MDTLFQEMLGGVGRLQENVGVTLFLKETDKTTRRLQTNTVVNPSGCYTVFT